MAISVRSGQGSVPYLVLVPIRRLMQFQSVVCGVNQDLLANDTLILGLRVGVPASVATKSSSPLVTFKRIALESLGGGGPQTCTLSKETKKPGNGLTVSAGISHPSPLRNISPRCRASNVIGRKSVFEVKPTPHHDSSLQTEMCRSNDPVPLW